MRRSACLAAALAAVTLFAAPARAHEYGVALAYSDFVAAAHARYEAEVLARGAWRIATGHIVRQDKHWPYRVAQKRKRARR